MVEQILEDVLEGLSEDPDRLYRNLVTAVRGLERVNGSKLPYALLNRTFDVSVGLAQDFVTRYGDQGINGNMVLKPHIKNSSVEIQELLKHFRFVDNIYVVLKNPNIPRPLYE